MIKEFKIFGELCKRGTETQNEQMLLEKGTDSLALHGAATNLWFVKTQHQWSSIKRGMTVAVMTEQPQFTKYTV